MISLEIDRTHIPKIKISMIMILLYGCIHQLMDILYVTIMNVYENMNNISCYFFRLLSMYRYDFETVNRIIVLHQYERINSPTKRGLFSFTVFFFMHNNTVFSLMIIHRSNRGELMYICIFFIPLSPTRSFT